MTFRIRRLPACATALLLLIAPVAVWAQGSPNPKLIEAAKKEGEIVYYTTMTLDQSQGRRDGGFDLRGLLLTGCHAPV